MTDNVARAAGLLRSYPFVAEDWTFTSNLGDLVAIRYGDPRERLWGRTKDAFHWLVRKQQAWERDLGTDGIRWRFRMFFHALKRDDHLPDGIVGTSGVITYWAETGEYLQLVQPSVGELVGNLLAAHPDLPEVQAVADEIVRVSELRRDPNT